MSHRRGGPGRAADGSPRRRDARHAPPTLRAGGTPTRRAGHRPKYVQYAGPRRALPQPPAGGDPEHAPEAAPSHGVPSETSQPSPPHSGAAHLASYAGLAPHHQTVRHLDSRWSQPSGWFGSQHRVWCPVRGSACITVKPSEIPPNSSSNTTRCTRSVLFWLGWQSAWFTLAPPPRCAPTKPPAPPSPWPPTSPARGPCPRGIGMRLRRVGRRTPRNTLTSPGEVRIRQKWGVP